MDRRIVSQQIDVKKIAESVTVASLAQYIAGRLGEVTTTMPNGEIRIGKHRGGGSISVHVYEGKACFKEFAGAEEHGDALDAARIYGGASDAKEAARICVDEMDAEASEKSAKPPIRKEKKSILGNVGKGTKWEIGLRTNEFKALLKKRGLEYSDVDGLNIGYCGGEMAFWSGDCEKRIRFDLKTGKRCQGKCDTKSNAIFCWPQDSPQKSSLVCVAEGEFTALALRKMGFQAYACKPEGEACQTLKRWVDAGFDIVACYDNDKTGEDLTKKAAALGVSRRVVWEGKGDKYDANDLLLDAGKDIGRGYIEAHTEKLLMLDGVAISEAEKQAIDAEENEKQAEYTFKKAVYCDAFKRSTIQKIASYLGLETGINCVSTHGALALVSLAIGEAHLYNPDAEDESDDYYRATIYFHVLADPGTCKTRCMNKLNTVAEKKGWVTGSPITGAKLVEDLVNCSGEYKAEDREGRGRPKMEFKRNEKPTPFLPQFDEDYAARDASRRDMNIADGRTTLLKTFGYHSVNLQSSKSTPVPTDTDGKSRVPVNCASIRYAATDKFIESLKSDPIDGGEKRRSFICVADDETVTPESKVNVIIQRREAKKAHKADYDLICRYLDVMEGIEEIWIDEAAADAYDEAWRFYRRHFCEGGNDCGFFETSYWNAAACFAAARLAEEPVKRMDDTYEGDSTPISKKIFINEGDINAAMALLVNTFEAWERLKPFLDEGTAVTIQERVEAQIIGRIKQGGLRCDNMRRLGSERRGIIEAMEKDGRIKRERRGSKYYYVMNDD